MKKPRVGFTVFDKNNEWMFPLFENSLRKWHTEEELPLVVWNQEKIDKVKDPAFFYRATPFIAKELIKDYDLVIKFDVDQLITGHLNHIFDTWDGYDVGTVYNINRVDPQKYGLIGLATIQPFEYYNNGLVALRSERFVNDWWKLCNSPHFDRMPMREQGFLNIMCHYGNWNVRCLDKWDTVHKTQAWNGLVAKGEGMKMEIRDNELWLPRGADNYPDHDVRVAAYHWAGGADEKKMNYRIAFSDEVIKWLDWLVTKPKEEIGSTKKTKTNLQQ